MLPVYAIPALLGVLVGLLLGLEAWGFLQVRRPEVGGALMETHDNVLLGLLVLAAFTMGVFLAYVLLT